MYSAYKNCFVISPTLFMHLWFVCLNQISTEIYTHLTDCSGMILVLLKFHIKNWGFFSMPFKLEFLPCLRFVTLGNKVVVLKKYVYEWLRRYSWTAKRSKSCSSKTSIIVIVKGGGGES